MRLLLANGGHVLLPVGTTEGAVEHVVGNGEEALTVLNQMQLQLQPQPQPQPQQEQQH